MSTAALYSKIELLPEHLKQQVLDYIEFLLSREGKQLRSEQQAGVTASTPPHTPSAAPLDIAQTHEPDGVMNESTDITPEQLAIIRHRMAEMESGTVQSIPGDAVRTKLKIKYGLQN
jgi:hypothetical protein